MRSLLIRWGIIALAVWITSLILPGMTIQEGVVGVLLVSLVFGLVNAVIKPIVKLLTCPLVILTLGLFTLVINMLMLLLVEFFLPNYLQLEGFFTPFIAALLISIVSTVLDMLLPDGK